MKQFKLPDNISPFKVISVCNNGSLNLNNAADESASKKILLDAVAMSIFTPNFVSMHDYENLDKTIRINPLNVRSVNIENNLGMNFGQIRMELVFSAGGDDEYTNIINILEKHFK